MKNATSKCISLALFRRKLLCRRPAPNNRTERQKSQNRQSNRFHTDSLCVASLQTASYNFAASSTVTSVTPHNLTYLRRGFTLRKYRGPPMRLSISMQTKGFQSGPAKNPRRKLHQQVNGRRLCGEENRNPLTALFKTRHFSLTADFGYGDYLRAPAGRAA